MLGEGAAFLLVEELESALARGVEPLAELAGAGLSCDAHHPTSPHPEGAGAARAVRAALSDAGVRPDDVGWVSAHGTGTPANDRAEVLALRSVFTGRRPPASSVKSLSGHGLGAASAIEAVLAVQALRSGCLPPTWHVGEQDPECDWDVMTDGPRPLRRRRRAQPGLRVRRLQRRHRLPARVVTAYVTAAAVFGPSGFTSSGLGPPGLVPDELLASSLTLRGLRPLSRTARLAMVAAAARVASRLVRRSRRRRRARLGPLERRPARRVRAGGRRARPRPGVPDGVPQHGRQRARRLRRHPARHHRPRRRRLRRARRPRSRGRGPVLALRRPRRPRPRPRCRRRRAHRPLR